MTTTTEAEISSLERSDRGFEDPQELEACISEAWDLLLTLESLRSLEVQRDFLAASGGKLEELWLSTTTLQNVQLVDFAPRSYPDPKGILKTRYPVSNSRPVLWTKMAREVPVIRSQPELQEFFDHGDHFFFPQLHGALDNFLLKPVTWDRQNDPPVITGGYSLHNLPTLTLYDGTSYRPQILGLPADRSVQRRRNREMMLEDTRRRAAGLPSRQQEKAREIVAERRRQKEETNYAKAEEAAAAMKALKLAERRDEETRSRNAEKLQQSEAKQASIREVAVTRRAERRRENRYQGND